MLKKRELESNQFGAPEEGWYTRKDKNFVREMKKYDKYTNMDSADRYYVNKLKDHEIY